MTRSFVVLIVVAAWLVGSSFLSLSVASAQAQTDDAPMLIVDPFITPDEQVVDESQAPVTAPTPVVEQPVQEPEAEPVAEPVAAEPQAEPTPAVEPKPAEQPAASPEPVAPAVEQPSAPAETEQADVFVDPEFALPPAAEVADLPAAAQVEAGWRPEVEYGGEFRARLGFDLRNEYTLIRETANSTPEAVGTEDVIDFRSSFEFWTRLKLHEDVQVYLEAYAEYFTVGKRNEDYPTIIFNGRNYRHEFFIEPREMYLDYFNGPIQLRVGNQIVSWGTLTNMSPSNRVNPRDIRAYYWSDISGSRMPEPAIRAIGTVSDLNFEIVWIPFFVSPPVDLYGGDFSLFRYGSMYGQTTHPLPDLNSYINKSKTGGYNPEFVTTKSVDANPVNSQIGARFSGSKSGCDFGLSYWYGYDALPTATFDPEVRAFAEAIARNETGLINGYAQDLIARLNNGESLEDLILSEYKRKHSLAFEFGASLWEFGIKLEHGATFDALYYTQNMLPRTYHTQASALGIDYMKTDQGPLSTLFINLEFYQNVLYGVPDDEPLMFNNDINLGLNTTIRFGFLDDDLEFEFVNTTNFNTKDTVFVFRATVRPVQNLSIILGSMILESWSKEPQGFDRYNANNDSKDTLFGRYSNNDQAYLMLRYEL